MNILLQTDSYKLNHWNQYPKDTEVVYSYFESRSGGMFPKLVFFGLSYYIDQLTKPITMTDVEEAKAIADAHLGPNKFNYEGWRYIALELNGKLPLLIKAVAEGSVLPSSTVLMTVENTDPKCFWLTNYLETFLSHTWYPSTVATLSYNVKQLMKAYKDATSDEGSGVDFMLHDFGCRGVSSMESAAIGGLAHLVSFKGTDTIPALLLAKNLYDEQMAGFSVSATEHSIMTARGVDGERQVLTQLLDEYPTGILSVVSDSYNIYNFVEQLVGIEFKDRILARDGVFVIRPDSTNERHRLPEDQIIHILNVLYALLPGSKTNTKGYKIINPKVKVLWGDGLDFQAIQSILLALKYHRYSLDNIATFGMGGGLLQKVNRDTMRFAFKCSAMKRLDGWHDVIKNPIGSNKKSKTGRFFDESLIKVFENGVQFNKPTLSEIRSRVDNTL